MSSESSPAPIFAEKQTFACRYLKGFEIEMIDEAIGTLGEFGEVRLIVEKGRVRFLVTQKSFDTLKWQPGSLKRSSR